MQRIIAGYLNWHAFGTDLFIVNSIVNLTTITMYSQNQISLFRTVRLLVLSVLFASSAIFAQQLKAQESPGYSDEELENFVQAVLEVIPLHQESQALMIQEIEEEDLTIETFNMILESQHLGEDPDVTEEKMDAFKNALLAVQALELEYNEKITEEIVDAGLSPARYEQIMADYQQDPELQMKVNQIMEEMDEGE